MKTIPTLKHPKRLSEIELDLATGEHYWIFFKNGYGASVIKDQFSYGGNEGLWELAVLVGNLKKYDLNYTSGITQDKQSKYSTVIYMLKNVLNLK